MSAEAHYDIRRDGIDFERLHLLLLKWPIYTFKFLRRGRFASIHELRRDAEIMARRQHQQSDHSERMVNPGTAIFWTLLLSSILFAQHVVPALAGVTSSLIVGGCMVSVIVALTSITREASKQETPSTFAWELVGGLFFVASTVPFALPWVLAFFFPRECILFFTVWAAFGAILGEVSVLVSHKAIMKGGPNTPLAADGKSADDDDGGGPWTDSVSAPTATGLDRVRPVLAKKRKRQTTDQRLAASVSQFSLDDKRELEDYLVSAEGLKWWASFLAMQGTISTFAVLLSLACDLFLLPVVNASSPWWMLMTVNLALVMSMCMLCEAFWMSYSVGGRWLHFRQKWRFFQPFSGGQSFMSFQVVSWSLFFSYFILSMRALREPARLLVNASGTTANWDALEAFLGHVDALGHVLGLHYCPPGTAAVFGVVAELLMLVSLTLYKGPLDENYLDSQLDEAIAQLERNESYSSITASAAAPPLTHDPIVTELAQRRKLRLRSEFNVPLWEFCADALRTAWLSPIILTLTKPEVVLFLAGFALTKFVHGAEVYGGAKVHLPSVYVAVIALYLPTYLGDPRRTGVRRKTQWMGTWVYDELAAYFYTYIIREAELNPAHKHVFGYHPHGMFPMAASYIHNTSQWMKLFPGMSIVTLTATITHIVPILREVTQWNGGIEVSAGSFTAALERFRNIMLVVGGQHEMLLVPDDPLDSPISTKHKGFIKLALLAAAQNDAVVNLVPVYNFGETECLYNSAPASIELQRWMVARFRANPLFLPTGRFNLFGVPKRVPVTIVTGHPLRVPVVPGQPTEAQIDLLHLRYFSALKETFDRHKLLCDYEFSRIKFVPALAEPVIAQEEFEARWALIADQSSGALADVKRPRDPPPYPEIAVAVLLSRAFVFSCVVH